MSKLIAGSLDEAMNVFEQAEDNPVFLLVEDQDEPMEYLYDILNQCITTDEEDGLFAFYIPEYDTEGICIKEHLSLIVWDTPYGMRRARYDRTLKSIMSDICISKYDIEEGDETDACD